MKKLLARLCLLIAAIGSATAQPMIPVGNISPVTGNSVIGRDGATGRGMAIPIGSGLEFSGGFLIATGGGGGGAPTNATYITQTPNATLTNEQALSLLSTGIMQVTSGTGLISSLAIPLIATYGGTGNAFTSFTGPAGAIKTFTLPNSSATILTTATAVTVGQGGTGQTAFLNGELLIGNTGTGGLTKATLTQGTGVTITNGAGTITIAATGLGGNVTNNATLTSGRVVLGGGTTVVGVLGAATNGQLLIGNSTNGLMQLGSITAGSNITVTPSAGGIQIAASGSGNTSATNTLTAGNLVQGAGTTNVATTNLSVLGNDLTVPGNITVGNMTTTNLTISGTITGVIPMVNGGTGFSTTTKGNIILGNNSTTYGQLGVGADGRVLTANSSATLGASWEVNAAGNVSAAATLTDNRLVLGNGTTSVNIIASAGNAGAPLLSAGAAAPPAFGAIDLAGGSNIVTGILPVGNGGIGAASLTANAVLVGGGSGAIAPLASLGTTGHPLVSAGAGAPPAFGVLGIAGGGTSLATLTAQSIFIGNGTNTPIQLAPGTSGNVATSNGTAWTSAPAAASSVALTATLGSDDTYSGMTLAGLNSGATIAQWEAVYVGGSSTYLLADANGASTYPARGLAIAAYVSTDPAIIIREGPVRNDAWAWTAGGTIYLSTTAGGLTQTPPAASGDKIQQVGFALTADIAYFNFASGEYLTVP